MTHRKRTREPEVIVFEEPRFIDVKRGREAAKEREKFLVMTDLSCQTSHCVHAGRGCVRRLIV